MAKNKIVLLHYMVLCFVVVTHSAPQSAIITNVPGFSGSLPSKHYSGYVTLDESHGNKLFYYFVESEGNPAKDPVVLWLNGGPACSSFDGFVFEHGPFNFQSAKTKGHLPTLHLNPYSWSKVSSVIYLDSPVGVGLSYSKNKSDYITGDKKTALDSHSFLLKWFQLYPEFISNPFFIAGESYAGVYVPTLATEVVKGIDAGIKPVLNFKGYLIGNGVTDYNFDENAYVPFVHGMGLISNDLYEEIKSACKGKFHDPATKSCAEKLGKVQKNLYGLNLYNILEPNCDADPEMWQNAVANMGLASSFRRLGEIDRPSPVSARMFGRAWPFRMPVREGRVPTWAKILYTTNTPCTIDDFASTWLNDAAVRKAIHADERSAAGDWELCTSRVTYNPDVGSMIPFHKNLTLKGYRALIYSGDHDMCVPYTGSEAWTRSMEYKVIEEWRPWISNKQIAGYIEEYANNLTFLTIKGAGHTVPEYKPREALDFYRRFLAQKAI